MKQVQKDSLYLKVASIISSATNPLYIAIPTFLVVALHSAPDILHGFIWWMITTVGITVAPFLFVWRGVRNGQYSDGHLSIRDQRIVPFLFSLACAGSTFVVLLLLQAAVPFLATIVSVLVAGVVALIITRYWTKVSLHVVGITGAVTVLVLVFGPFLLVLFPLLIFVGWARWQLHAHTPFQMVLAMLLAVGIPTAIFRLFGV